MTVNPKPPFHVLIVGAGVSGLTLAHSLNAANISWTLLEARPTPTPLSGAGLVIGPNGSRILDQLHLFDRLAADGLDVGNQKWWGGDGQLLYHDESAEETVRRLGYHAFSVDRTNFVQSLYRHLSNKSQVHFRAKVISLDHLPHGVRLTCENGSKYTGDVVVGTDGVHSFIRSKMQQIFGNPLATGQVHPDHLSITASYRCIYGVSPVPGDMDSNVFHINLDNRERMTFAYATGANKMTWVFELPLEKRVKGKHELPRQDQAEMASLLAPYRDMPVAGCTALGALWDTRTSARLALIEEARHSMWTAGRLVCCGDSIHKMSPNIGQGANQGIESAAALASQLVHMLDWHDSKSNSSTSRTLPLSQSDIEPFLQSYQGVRQTRADTVVRLASTLTQYQVFSHTLSEQQLQGVIQVPLADFYSRTCAGASRLDFLPEPARALASREKFAMRHIPNSSLPATKPARL